MPKRKLAVEPQEPAERPKRTRAAASAAAQRITKNITGKTLPSPKAKPTKTPPSPKVKPVKTPPSPKGKAGKASTSSKEPKTTTSKTPPSKTPKRTSLRKSPPKRSPSKPALKKPTVKRVVRKPAPIEKLPLDTSASGELFVHGNNEAGQLSLEDTAAERRFPFQIQLTAFGNEKIVEVVCGEMHSVVVTESGKVFTWGCNDEGALGTGKEEDDDTSYRPKPVTGIEGKIIAVSAGDSHTAFLNDDGMIYLTGTMRDSSGKFGLRPDSSELCEFEPFLYHNPRRSDLRNDRAVKVSSGQNHLAFLCSGGEVYVMGDPDNGPLGAVSSRRLEGGKRHFLEKRDVLRLKKPKVVKFRDVWCTPYATFVKSAREDRWFVCGNNSYNQLGFPHTVAEPNKPVIVTDWAEVAGFRDQKVIKIVGTTIQTLALTADGRLLACGDTEYLGLSATLQRGLTDVPVELPFTAGGQKVRDIGCSSNNAVVCVTEAGEVFVWGSPSSSIAGRLPDDDSADAVPQARRIQDVGQTPGNIKRKPFEDFRMVQVAVGASHALLIGKPAPLSNKTVPATPSNDVAATSAASASKPATGLDLAEMFY